MKQHVMLIGGIGNQMFIYALYVRMKSLGKDVILDASMYDVLNIHSGYELNKFQIDDTPIRGRFYAFIYRIIKKFAGRYFLEMDNECYNENIFYTKKYYIDGYWQSFHYFDEVEGIIRRKFQFRNIDSENIAMMNRMQSCNSVSLHVRRGDYKGTPGEGICTENYYYKAVEIMKNKVDNPFFFIFSDDKEYCECFFEKLDINYHIVDINHGNNNCYDIYLMSNCKNNIIANSSFSWWGAWLNNNTNKIVVAPSRWNQISNQLNPQLPEWILVNV